MADQQESLLGFDYSKHAKSDADKYGYSPGAEKLDQKEKWGVRVRDGEEQEPHPQDVWELSEVSKVTERSAKRILSQYDGLKGVVETARGEDPIEEFTKCGWISNQMAAAIVRRFSDEC